MPEIFLLLFQILYLMNLSKCVCLQDFRDNAKQIMPKEAFTYIDSGAEEEITLHENEKAFQKLMIIPRILKSISNPTIKTTIFGLNCDYPFGFSPWAMNQLSHPDGECVGAKVAFENKIIYNLSILSNKSLKDVVKNNQSGCRFMQLYVSNNWKQTLAVIRLAEKYHFTGLAITVDTQVLGIRRRQKMDKFDSSYLQFPVLQELNNEVNDKNITERTSYLKNRDLDLSWMTIKKIRESTKLKIILKGIINPLDAQIALKYCDAIWVSNHGGRQLDMVLPTIQALPGIKAVVDNKLPIFIDCGIRTGNDIFKCLALGADYVFVGRPLAYSLCFGEEGVQKMVQILADEFKRTMILVGCHNLKEIEAKYIKQSPNL